MALSELMQLFCQKVAGLLHDGPPASEQKAAFL